MNYFKTLKSQVRKKVVFPFKKSREEASMPSCNGNLQLKAGLIFYLTKNSLYRTGCAIEQSRTECTAAY